MELYRTPIGKTIRTHFQMKLCAAVSELAVHVDCSGS